MSALAAPAAWAVASAAAVPLALCIDHALGEPPARAHPVVWMGRALGAAGARIAPRTQAAGRWRNGVHCVGGVLAWLALAGAVTGVAWAVSAALRRHAPPWLAALALALALKPLFAWRLLADEVRGVEQALATSLAAGRDRLARLVSRDVAALDASAVREAAIESLAENLSDSLVAPLFWFAVAGLPGAALYRFANTADAMWGYPGWRGGRWWLWAGKWAARADDVLSWLPARLTACALVLLAPRAVRPAWRRVRAEARRTPSPNGGWPMGAMALLLGVRLGKPGAYVLNACGRAPQAGDVARAIHAASKVAVAGAIAGPAAILLIAMAGVPRP